MTKSTVYGFSMAVLAVLLAAPFSEAQTRFNSSGDLWGCRGDNVFAAIYWAPDSLASSYVIYQYDMAARSWKVSGKAIPPATRYFIKLSNTSDTLICKIEAVNSSGSLIRAYSPLTLPPSAQPKTPGVPKQKFSPESVQSFTKDYVTTDQDFEAYSVWTKSDLQNFLNDVPGAGKSFLATYSTTDYNGNYISAVDIIYNASQSYHLNPQVILTTLQKEQGLVTMPTVPSSQSALDDAMGYAPGNSTYGGFGKQVDAGAWQLGSKDWSTISGGGNISGWSKGVAKVTDDGVSVTPQNFSTACLYSYTPNVGYQWGGDSPSYGGNYLYNFVFYDQFGFGTSSNTNLPAPLLSTPADGATNQSLQPTFSWSSVSGAASYRIMVATNSTDLPTDPTAGTGGSSVIINDTPTGTSYTPSVTLNPGTKYYWEVHARSASYYGTWSSIYSFTTKQIAMTIDPSSQLDFGSVEVGQSKTMNITITNSSSSTADLVVGSSPSTSPFQLINGASLSLAPGKSYSFVFTFTPTAAGTYNQNWVITHNATNWSSPWTIVLKGTGTTSQVTATVQTNPSGRSFSVDGTGYSSTQTFSWSPGSSHTLATTSPQAGATGTQYVWNNWNDHGTISHSVSPGSNATYTANFTTQYYLTMNSETGGGVSPSSSWCDSGQVVPILATPSSGYTFSGWTGSGTGSYTGPDSSASVTMDGPITEAATFIAASEPILSVTPDSQSVGPGSGNTSFDVSNKGTGAMNWSAESGASWITIVNGSSGTNAGTISASYQANAGGARTGVITVTAGGAAGSPKVVKIIQAAAQAQTYQVTASSNPSIGGTVSGGGTYTSGQSVTVLATPGNGWAFVDWTSSGVELSTTPSYTFTVTRDTNLVANFRQLAVGGAYWTQSSGPYSYINGPYAVEKAPDGTLFAVGSASAGKSYVFRSIDNGDSWLPVSPGEMTSAAYAIAIDGAGIVYVGTDGQGLWRSTDNGGSWSQVGTSLSKQIFSVAAGSNGKVYAISGGTLHASTDEGQTWNTFGSQSTPASLMSVSVSPGGSVFVGSAGGTKWYMSTDNGSTWTNLPVAVGGASPFAFSTSGAIYFASSGNGVYVSTDGGTSWQNPNVGFPTEAYGSRYAYSIAVSNDGTVIAGTDSGRVFASTDGASSWSSVGERMNNLRVTCLAVAQDGQYVAAGGGVFAFKETSGSWVQTGFPTSTVSALDVSSTGNWLAYDSYYSSLEVSTDQGATWTSAGNYPSEAGVYTLQDLTNGGDLASGSQGTYRSTDGGLSWSPVNSSIIATSFLDVGGHLLAVTVNGTGLASSTDDGASWTQLPGAITGAVTAGCLSSDGRGNVLFATSSTSPARVFRSTDYGATWQPPDTLQGSGVSCIANDNDSTIFAATDIGLYRSNDHGKTWTPDSSFPVQGCYEILTTGEGIVLVATKGKGVYISYDYGDSWEPLNDGLKNLTVRSLAERSNGGLIAGTEGSGVFYAPAPVMPVKLSPPLLSSPSNGSGETSLSLTLSWNPSEGALAYRVIVARDSSFDSTVVDSSDIASTNIRVKLLSGLTKYYWKVEASNESGTSSWSATWNFTTGKPSQFITIDLRDSIFQAHVYSANAENNWTTSVKPYVRNSNGWVTPRGFNITCFGLFIRYGINPPAISGSVPDSDAINAPTDSLGLATVADYVINSPNSIDLKYGLGDGRVVGYGDVRFVVQIKDNLGYATLLDSTIDDSAGWRNFHADLSRWSDSTVTLRLITDPNGVTWDDWAYWADVKVERVIATRTPPSPLLVSPRDTKSEPRRTTFVWNSSAYATSYRLQIASDSAFFSVVLDTTAMDTSARLSVPLSPTSEYYWRVQAINAFGSSDYSAVAKFETGTGIDAVDDPSRVPRVFALYQNFPNPFNPTTTISYDLPEKSHVLIVIYDVLGRKVGTLVNEDKPAGSFRLTFDADRVASGVYFYRLDATGANGKSFTSIKKMLFLK